MKAISNVNHAHSKVQEFLDKLKAKQPIGNSLESLITSQEGENPKLIKQISRKCVCKYPYK